MKITLEGTSEKAKERRTIIIQSPYDDYVLEDIFTDFIRPLLIAWGYHPQSIDSLVIPDLRLIEESDNIDS